MRILNITAQKPHHTGSGTYLTELVRAFDRLGAVQGVVCGITPDDRVSLPDAVRVYPVYYSGQDLAYPVLGMSDVMPYASTRYCDLTEEMTEAFESAFIRVISRAVREIDPDIILCHHLFLLTALVRKHFPERTVCGLCHGSDLRQLRNALGAEGSPYTASSHLTKLAPDLVRGIGGSVSGNRPGLDGMFALHGKQAEQIRSLFLTEDTPAGTAGRIRVVGTGYNPDIFNSGDARTVTGKRTPDGPVRIMFAGKICREKGIPELLRALEQAASGLPSFELVLAGGCKDPAVLDLLTNNWSFPVVRTGILSQPELAKHLRLADLFVLPSYYEGLPLVLIEAMACGTRTLCTDLPGVKDWLDESIPDHDTVFVELPAMCGVDTPDPAAVPAFTDRMSEAVMRCVSEVFSSEPRRIPDTSPATWEALAGRILRACPEMRRRNG